MYSGTAGRRNSTGEPNSGISGIRGAHDKACLRPLPLNPATFVVHL
jgi:hypothetical protein